MPDPQVPGQPRSGTADPRGPLPAEFTEISELAMKRAGHRAERLETFTRQLRSLEKVAVASTNQIVDATDIAFSTRGIGQDLERALNNAAKVTPERSPRHARNRRGSH